MNGWYEMPAITIEPSEDVVLLDERGQACGTQPKATVHTERTPLHLAFSSYVVNAEGAVLLTRRAPAKPTWPGVLTNTCCGHPLPGEPLADAVRRKLLFEIGVRATTVDLVLPRFRYWARMDNGTVENEMCPVFRVTTEDSPQPNPEETSWTGWHDWAELVAAVRRGSLSVSPWCEEQIEQLSALGPDPLVWPVADSGDLPPAAKVPESSRTRPTP